jgi:5-methylcytosine-specific restriction endonuclease McrA
MGGESLSIDQREQRLVAAERAIGKLRELQMQDLAELDVVQIATADGSRSLSEWVSARLDCGIESARSLVRTMRRLRDRPHLQERLAEGSVSFDRVEALSRIYEDVGLMEWADISAIRREASKRARVRAESEHFSARDRYHVMQPSLDESRWKYWGALDGSSGALVNKVLCEAADALPDLPDGSKGSRGWRQATALVECLVSDDPPPAQVTVIVDAEAAAETDGEAGVTLEAGPNVGRQALQAVLCDADTEVVARTEDGRFMDYGRRQRTGPPSLKRALLARYNQTCGADGCTSRHRLQVHHVIPWAQGGETSQDNLVVLCWYHHQIVVHERGYQIVYHHDPRRIRFHRPKDPPRPT